jgi:hypothetical protein
MKTTHTKPPVEIYDVLQECEKAGIKLPESVDAWFQVESLFDPEEGKWDAVN